MRVIIAGGGTGGHIFPAISIAEEILRRNPENSVLFIGTREGLEKRTVFQLGYKLEFISSRGIVGKGIIRGIRGIASAFKGLIDSFRIMSKFGPDVVLGVGGYVSGPVVCAAVLLLVPTAICEQNSIPGITNRFLGRLVRRVFASFEESVRFFPRKVTVVVGNPVRTQILQKGKWSQKKREGITILVFGGSQGARTLNLTVPRALGILARQDISIIHQTGEKDVEDVKKSYEWYGIRASVLPFIEDMASAYSQADLVIGRAGAGTLAEITAIGIPSILVPYPFAAYNHQLENARIVQRTGAAVIVEDKDVTPEKFAEILGGLLKNDILEEMAKQAKSLGRPDAAREIVDEIYELAGSKYIATKTQRHQEER
jgi:UDP-N-acetylglucosamine--N-acetylmuramyl-(pentapeptide) pyrophosphoryl-undecaprenol N-acetylglucosamine transferase